MRATTRLTLATTCAAALTLTVGKMAHADTVVQIPIDSLLDARPVSTLINGVVVPWTAGQGVDGDGNADGFVTLAVEAKLGQTGNALPNDGVFPAANGLPEIDLHFSNDSPATTFQAHNAHSGVAASIQFAVPQATYSKIFLVLTDSENADMLTVTMTYADSTTSVTGPFTMPDYDQGLPANTADVTYFSLISMHKWSQTDQQGDNAGHSITGVTLVPSPTKALTGITIAKPDDGHYLVFWGATGIATSAVDAGSTGGGVVEGGVEPEDGGGSDSSIGSSGGASGAASGEAATGSSGSAQGSGSVASAGTSGSTAASGTSTSSSGATSGTLSASSGASLSGASGSNTETSSTGGSSKSGCACSLSSTPRSHAALWGSLLVLWGAARRRRRA